MSTTVHVPLPDGRSYEFIGPDSSDWPYWERSRLRPEKSWLAKTRTFANILTSSPDIRTLVETGGGLGIFARMARERWHLDSHVVIEIDDKAIPYLQATGATVIHAPAQNVVKSYVSQGTDFVFVDFSEFTTYYLPTLWQRNLLQQLGEIRPRRLLITDSASGKFHLNRPLYEARFGRPLTLESYYETYEELLPGYYLERIYSFKTVGGGGAHVSLQRRQM